MDVVMFEERCAVSEKYGCGRGWGFGMCWEGKYDVAKALLIVNCRC